MEAFLFYGLCAVLLALGAATVLSRSLFRAALAFSGVILCTAVLFFALGAEMTALVQVMVYIGGVMIFVLYAIFLTSEAGGALPRPGARKALVAALLALPVLAVFAWQALRWRGASGEGPRVPLASLESLGLRLLDPGPDGFLVPFELISVLLLAALVGAIAVAAPAKGEE